MLNTADLTKNIATAQDLVPPKAENYPKRQPDVNVRAVEGEIVILDRQKGLIHQLNRTASYIWDRCDGKSTVAELSNQVAEVFDVDLQTAAKDVAATVWQLRRLNLLDPGQEFTAPSEP